MTLARKGRGLALAGVVMFAVATAGAVAAPSPGARTPSAARPTHDLAQLLTSHGVISTLGAHQSPVSTVQASRPLTGAQTVLPVVGHATGTDGARWLRVMLPGRRRVLVYRHGRLLRLSDRSIRLLAARVGPGVPVAITP